MGNELSRQGENLRDLQNRNGCNFPGYDYRVQDRKNWMSTLAPERLHANQIVWPEIIILEISREFGQQDPSDFDRYLEAELGEFLIHQDDNVFNKTIAELLPKRIICIWKPRNSPEPRQGGPLWSSCYLKGDWTNTDLPETKFENNMQHLSNQPPVTSRIFFYKVENTVTAQANAINLLFSTLWVEQLNLRIQPFARLFIMECISRGYGD
uniref:Phospholipase C n=1 Tax=Solanum tuberosum TaxID=4113 RepID=M1C4M1_SOLTU